MMVRTMMMLTRREELSPQQSQERMEEMMGGWIGETQSKEEIFLVPQFWMLAE
jgi:hypothetical protein